MLTSDEKCLAYVLELKYIYVQAKRGWDHYKAKVSSEMGRAFLFGLALRPDIGINRSQQLDRDRTGCGETMDVCRENMCKIWNKAIDFEWPRVRELIIEDGWRDWLMTPNDWWELDMRA